MADARDTFCAQINLFKLIKDQFFLRDALYVGI